MIENYPYWNVKTPMSKRPNKLEIIEEKIAYILDVLGYDLTLPSLEDTPRRVATHLFEYRKQDTLLLEKKMKDFIEVGFDEIIVKRGIKFNSMCEHHLLPYIGTVDIAYLPSEAEYQSEPEGFRVIGTSKMARIVGHFAQAFSVQERLTKQIADFLRKQIKPRGVWVIITANHMCEHIRGVKNASEMVTSVITGIFKQDPSVKAEAQFLLGG